MNTTFLKATVFVILTMPFFAKTQYKNGSNKPQDTARLQKLVARYPRFLRISFEGETEQEIIYRVSGVTQDGAIENIKFSKTKGSDQLYTFSGIGLRDQGLIYHGDKSCKVSAPEFIVIDQAKVADYWKECHEFYAGQENKNEKL